MSGKFKEYQPRTWKGFLSAVNEARNGIDLKPGEECFYRGHSYSEWPLLPTLFRISAGLTEKAINSIEASLFWEFRARASEVHAICRSDWDYLFHMRHHGVYTRLLDWTEVLGVAIYFALRNDAVQRRDAAVWVLNPYLLNSMPESWAWRDIIEPRYITEQFANHDYGDLLDSNWFPRRRQKRRRWYNPVAIYPLQSSVRMRAQRGWFTIHGRRRRPLEELAPHCVAKVVLPSRLFADAQRFLEHTGLTDSVLFPGLDGLANEVNRKADTWRGHHKKGS